MVQDESWAVLLVLSGTLTTVILKSQFSIQTKVGTEYCGVLKKTMDCPFDKPWFGVLEMKLAMASCLVYLQFRKLVLHKSYLETPLLKKYRQWKHWVSPGQSRLEKQRLMVKSTSHPPSWKTVFILLGTSALDLFQTVLGNIGLLWISSSVYQMARGSMVVFTAILSVRYMNKKLHGFHYTSLAMIVSSIVLVGVSEIMSNKDSSMEGVGTSDQLLGFTLIIIAQFLCAVQIIIEEHVLTNLQMPPMMLVGYEGVWGIFLFTILAPLLTLTKNSTASFSKVYHENFIDSFTRVYHSSTLLFFVFAYILTIAVFNVSAGHVTKIFSGIVRSILETVRTVGIWICSLLIYYVYHEKHSPGEAWTSWSYLQLLGFILLVYGTLTYKKILILPIPQLYPAQAPKPSPFLANVHP